jgi:hypothetical protein
MTLSKKEKAKKDIKKILAEVNDLLDKATEIADEHEISFDFKPSTLGTYHPRELIWQASGGCEWEASDEWADAHWSHEHIDWQASTC